MGVTGAGVPYPEGTDKVVNGDDAIKAVALKVNGTRLGAGFRDAAGTAWSIPGSYVTIPGMSVAPAATPGLIEVWGEWELEVHNAAATGAIAYFQPAVNGVPLGFFLRMVAIGTTERASVSGRARFTVTANTANTFSLMAQASNSSVVVVGGTFIVTT